MPAFFALAASFIVLSQAANASRISSSRATLSASSWALAASSSPVSATGRCRDSAVALISSPFSRARRGCRRHHPAELLHRPEVGAVRLAGLHAPAPLAGPEVDRERLPGHLPLARDLPAMPHFHPATACALRNACARVRPPPSLRIPTGPSSSNATED